MTPEVDRAIGFGLVLASLAAGATITAGLFWAADRATTFGFAAYLWFERKLAPTCPDCLGKGWRRYKDGDGAPVKGWRDCKLCRGSGKIVD